LRLFFAAQNGIQMEATASIQNHQTYSMNAGSGDYHQLPGSNIHTLSGSAAITAANVVLGSSLNADLGNASLTASSGTITEAAAGTITATNLVMSAKTGIGTSGLALATAVSILNADTVTGGIFIGNTGDLSIGAALD